MNGVVRSIALSTWASPSTARRTPMPRAWMLRLCLVPHASSWSLAQVAQQRRREGVRLLDVRDVRSPVDHSVHSAVRDRRGERVSVGGGHDGVVGAREHERRRRDLREPSGEVDVGECVAAGRVPLGAGSR